MPSFQEAIRETPPSARERAEQWIAENCPGWVGHPLVLGFVMLRIDYEGLSGELVGRAALAGGWER